MSFRLWGEKIWRSVRNKGAVHWGIFAALILVGSFVGVSLENGPAMTGARYCLYRHLMSLQSQAPVYPERTAVVLLEDDDYWSESFAGRSPVHRERLGQILTTLGEAGVQTIALDVDLRSPDGNCPGCDFEVYRKEDSALFAAMKLLCAQGRWLVVGTSVRFSDGMYTEVPSLYTWAKANDSKGEYKCVTPGYLQLPPDLRQLPGQLDLKDGNTVDSFAMVAEQRVDLRKYTKLLQAPDRGFRFSRYLSEKDYGGDAGPYVFSAKQLEAAHAKDPHGLQQQLADRVVLVGGGWHQFGIGQGPLVDVYDSPAGPMPGVFVHANYIEALQGERGTFAPMPDWMVRTIEFGLAVALALLGAQEIHAGWKWLAFSGCILISFLLTYVLLENLGIFMDFLVPLCILIVHTLVEEVIAWRHELHHLRLHVKELLHEAKVD